MVDVASRLRGRQKRLEAFRTNWIGRCLANFGVSDDIAAVVHGDGLTPPLYAAMKRLLLTVHWVDGIPVILAFHAA